MKIPSILNSLRAFGLATLAAGALATTPTASAGSGFNGPFNPIAPDGSFTANGWIFLNSPPAPGYSDATLSYTLSHDKQTLTLVVTSPAGLVTAGQGLNSFQYANFNNFATG